MTHFDVVAFAGMIESWLLGEIDRTPEELIDRCGLAAPRVMSLVTMLEMDGILRREKGRLILGTW